MRVRSGIAKLLILPSRKMNGHKLKTSNYLVSIHKWVAGGCRWANSFSAAVWAVETGLHGAIPVFLFTLDGIARWRLLERKRSPAIREVTPTDSPMSPFQQASARSESLPAPELPSSWPMFDPSQYWPTQASLDFLPGLAPSHVEQMQVQQSSHPHRTNISLSSPEGGDFRTTHSMITPYRYPASFDPVFAALEQPQEIDYAETPEVPMQADILELQSSIASDPDTQSDSSSASALPCDVEMDSALTNQLDVGTREEESHNINEHPLDDPENAVSDYDNCQPPSPTPPPENASQQTNPVEANVVDRRLPRLSSMLATSSE
jgi:hypothetical protein